MVQYNKLRSHIESVFPQLTKSEKKVAEYALNFSSDILDNSLQDLSKKLQVSESTVLRFCKKIGFPGFPSFKVAFAQNLAYAQSNYDKKQEESDYAEVIKNNVVERIENTYTLINHDSIDKAISLISSARHVLSIGVGGSGIAAMTCKERFTRIGKITDCATDAHRQSILVSVLDHRDVLIVFSVSGNIRDIITSTEIARKNNVNIIVVTSYIKSEVSKFADVILQTAAKKRFIEGGTLVATISQLYVVELLVTGVALLDYANSHELHIKTVLSLMDKQFDIKTFNAYWTGGFDIANEDTKDDSKKEK